MELPGHAEATAARAPAVARAAPAAATADAALAEARAHLGTLQQEVADLRDRLDGAHAERDRWRRLPWWTRHRLTKAALVVAILGATALLFVVVLGPAAG